MNFSTDELFALLPAFMRLRDAAEGAAIKARTAADDPRPAEDFGPLRTLASLIAREAQVLDEQLSDTYADSFIETCAPWVVPYLGDLLGMQGLEDIPEGLDLRGRVADALALRARRGTLRALEHAASEASGLPVMAVEYGRRLVHAQSLRLPHPAMGAAVDFRNRRALARVDTAFDRLAHGVEVRRIDSPARGRFNIGNVGLHVWGWQPWAIGNHAVLPLLPGGRLFRFHPLGCDAQLFDRARARPGIEQPALSETDLPVAISRAIMAEDPGRFYGDGAAMRVFVDGAEVPLAEIRVANLADRSAPGAEPWNRTSAATHTLIDPELGRLVVGDNRPGPVRLSCHFARPLAIGGGEQARLAAIGSIEGAIALDPQQAIATQIADAGGQGIFRLDESSHYQLGDALSVPDDGLLRLIAAEGRFPTIALPALFTLTLGRNARVELNGLRLHGGTLRLEGAADAPGALLLQDCTLVPGHALDRLGDARNPGAVSLQLAATGIALLLNRVITGPVELAADVEAGFTDSIIDAGSHAARAIYASPGALRHVVSFMRCTVLGRVETDSFAGGQTAESDGNDGLPASSDTLFLGAEPAIVAARQQVGCIRFSHVPQGALVPRLHRCDRGPMPAFRSQRYADPGYFQLAASVPDSIRRGAEDGGEMGAGNLNADMVRHDNITRSIHDFLRFGHSAGIFLERAPAMAGRDRP